MKKEYLYRCILVIFPLFSWACSEKESVDLSSSFSLYGVEFRVADQMIWRDDANTVVEIKDYVFSEKYTKSPGKEVLDEVTGFSSEVKDFQTGNFIVSLYGEGVSLNAALLQAVGEGACISLHLASPDKEKLAAGKYVFSAGKDKYTFVGYSTSCYSNLVSSYPVNPIASGEVNVEVADDGYVISFTGRSVNGGVISGNFSGVIPMSDIRKVPGTDIMSYKDLKLSAFYTRSFDNGDSRPDYWITGFFSSSLGGIYSPLTIGYWSAGDSKRKNVDIALACDQRAREVFFESPIRTRALLLYDTYANYTLYGHTVYMNAPAGFSDADFDSLSRDQLNFSVIGEKVSMPLPVTATRYVFFQNGYGVKGVIKVKSVSDIGSVNPLAVLDIKVMRTYPVQIK